MSRAADLRAVYELLGKAIEKAEPTTVGSLIREYRLLGAELERIENPSEVSFVDELAVKRSVSGVGRPPARRKSG